MANTTEIILQTEIAQHALTRIKHHGKVLHWNRDYNVREIIQEYAKRAHEAIEIITTTTLEDVEARASRIDHVVDRVNREDRKRT